MSYYHKGWRILYHVGMRNVGYVKGKGLYMTDRYHDSKA